MQSETATPVNPLTGDRIARTVTGGPLTKVVHCTFHCTLPWLALTPKHGESVFVWDYQALTLVGHFDLLSLLNAQMPALVSSGEWTSAHCGKIVAALFHHGPHAEWQFDQQRLQRFDPAMPSAVATAGPTRVPTPLNVCRLVETARLRRQVNLSDVTSGTAHQLLNSSMSGYFGRGGPAAGGAAGADGAADGGSLSGAGAGGDAVGVVAVTSTLAMVVDLATGTVTHVLPAQHLKGREPTVAKLLVVETAARFGFTYDAVNPPPPAPGVPASSGAAAPALLPGGASPHSVGPLTTEVVIGCADGSIVVWTLLPPPAQLSKVASEAALAPRPGIVRFVKTPHNSMICDLVPFAFINTTSYKRKDAGDPEYEDPDDYDDDDDGRRRGGGRGGAPPTEILATRKRSSFVSFIYATKGGSVGHVCLYGAPDAMAAQARAGGSAADDLAPSASSADAAAAQQSESLILFSRKNVHKHSPSTAVSPIPPSLLFSASPKTYVGDSTTADELVEAHCALRTGFTISDDAITVFHARSGIETRRVPLDHTIISAPPVALFATPFSLHIITSKDDHFTMNFDCSVHSVRPWLRVSELVPITSGNRRAERAGASHPSGSITTAPGVPAAAGDDASDDDGRGGAFTASTADVRVYAALPHPTNPSAVSCVLTNEGCIVVEAGGASPLQPPVSGGKTQTQTIFPLPPTLPRSLVDAASKRSSGQRGSSGSGSGGSKSGSASSSSASITASAVHMLVHGAGSRVQTVTLQDTAACAEHASLGGGIAAPETRRQTLSHYVLSAMHDFVAVGARDNGTDALPPVAAAAGASSVTKRTLLEPSPTFNVRSIEVTPRGDLVAIVTDARELLVFELGPGGAIGGAPLMLPAGVKQAAPDAAAWSHDGLHIALLNFDRGEIVVAQLDCRSGGRYTFGPQPPCALTTSNIPRGMTGGRWLCVHFEPTFTGCLSQFHLWLTTSRGGGGGGALGSFIAQPQLLEWDLTATLCALVYPDSITFAQAHRKAFSVVCSTELRTTAHTVRFVRRALVVITSLEVLMLLPTPAGVHKLVLASTTPSAPRPLPLAVLARAGVSSGARQSKKSNAKKDSATIATALTAAVIAQQKGAARFDAAVRLRPPGHLMFANFDEIFFDLYVADECGRVCRVPLAGTMAHLMWTLHSAPHSERLDGPGSSSSAPSNVPAAGGMAPGSGFSSQGSRRGGAAGDAGGSGNGGGQGGSSDVGVAAGVVGWQAAFDMLETFLSCNVGRGTGSRLLFEAVEEFAKACGCGALLAHCLGEDALSRRKLAGSTTSDGQSPLAGGGDSSASRFDRAPSPMSNSGHGVPPGNSPPSQQQQQQASAAGDASAPVLDGVMDAVDAALFVVQQLAADFAMSSGARQGRMTALRTEIRARAVELTFCGTADGWALSDGGLPERLAELLLERADSMDKMMRADADGAPSDADGGMAVQLGFLRSLAREFIERRFH